jgi:hypothetical protein
MVDHLAQGLVGSALNEVGNSSVRLFGLAQRIILALWQLSYRQCERTAFGACR